MAHTLWLMIKQLHRTHEQQELLKKHLEKSTTLHEGTSPAQLMLQAGG